MFDLSKFSLQGKVALITGGSRGIGQGIAFGFAKAGAKVVITSRKAQDLEATASEIKAFGGEVLVLPAHLGKIEEIQRVIGTVMEKYGRIDILVNNAGASPAMGTVLDSDERLWGHDHESEFERPLFPQPGSGQNHEGTGRRQDH